MQVTCPACKKVSNSKVDLSGKSVKCSCGQSFVVPKAVGATTQTAQSPTTAASPPTPTISLKCECGKGHRVPETAAGKAVKCSCGKTITVPQPTAPLNPFHALSDDDWANLAPKPPPAPDPYAPPKPPSATSQLLAKAREEMGETKKASRQGDGGQLAQSRWILIGIGALKLLISGIQFALAETSAAAIVARGAENVTAEEIRIVIQVIAGFGIATSVAFILMGVFIFLMPMTCSISALVLFVLLELVSFIFNPLLLFGALVQGINNASYYKFVKSGARDP
jgi:predicted Zn finger-like uncharacterized protein